MTYSTDTPARTATEPADNVTHDIDTIIDGIGKSLEWVRKNKPETYAQKFGPLVNLRKELRTIRGAEQDNPGIAAFGKSQVGKSYLVSNLLKGKDKLTGRDKPFTVSAPGGASYDFVTQVNPPSDPGGGKESTGVVTRFTSFSRATEQTGYSPEYPVMVKTFTVADIILILADTYYNDLSDYEAAGESDAKARAAELNEAYADRPAAPSPLVGPDDVLVMRDYFDKHINHAQALVKTGFFDSLAFIADKIPAGDYAEVYSFLWSGNSQLTRLFTLLFDTLRTLGFERRVYLPVEAVLHRDIKENTIMSVQCLKQLLSQENAFKTDVYARRGGQTTLLAQAMPKSAVCAVCAEVVFKIDEDFLKSSGKYNKEGMDKTVSDRLSSDTVSMEMLRGNDLLDFPGARSREQSPASSLANGDTLLNNFLRGKVAYLFNKYNDDKAINILLFCHHNKDNDVTNLYKLAQEWVGNYVGQTPEERRRTIGRTKVSPFFLIGTMFNLDLTRGVDGSGSPESIDQRWVGRFQTVVNAQVLGRDKVEWVNNWTRPGEDFKNTYLLRDYKYSKDIYTGYKDTGAETGLTEDTRADYGTMRSSFVKNEHVRRLFRDPELSWDVSATPNNDGALYIMEQLAVAAGNTLADREAKFSERIKAVKAQAIDIMKPFHQSEEPEKRLRESVTKARAVLREMDFTCNADNYYFGHLIQALQLTETRCYQVIHRVMQSPELNTKVNDWTDYEIIHASCRNNGTPISEAKGEEAKWQCVISTYGFSGREQAEHFLRAKGVEPDKLFGKAAERKTNSRFIADAVFDQWAGGIRSAEFIGSLTAASHFDTTAMSNLIESAVTVAEDLGLRRKMDDTIAPYVNVTDIHTASETLLADTLADTINAYVLDMGYSLQDPATLDQARQTCQAERLPAFRYIDRPEPEKCDTGDLTDMFNSLSDNPRSLVPSFEENYNKWMEYMLISFIAGHGHGITNPEANEALARILAGMGWNAG